MATIDFASILAGDPVYQDALKSIAASKLADYTDLNNSRYADLIRFGEVPTDPVTGQPWSPTDPETQQPIGIPPTVLDNILASTRSGFSTVAGINNAYQTAISQLKGNLGERNMFRSGDYAYGLNKGLRAEQLGRAGAQDTLFTGAGGLNELVRNYLSLIHGLAGDQQTAAMDAFNRAAAQINAGLGSTPPGADNGGGGGSNGGGGGSNGTTPTLPPGIIAPTFQPDDPSTPLNESYFPQFPVPTYNGVTPSPPSADPNNPGQSGLLIGDDPRNAQGPYAPYDPNNPSITYTPVYTANSASYEPKTASDTNAYAAVLTAAGWGSPSDAAAYDAFQTPSIALQSIGSDAAQYTPPSPTVPDISYPSAPIDYGPAAGGEIYTPTYDQAAAADAAPNALQSIGSDAAQYNPINYAAPRPAGYGGTATSGQVARNTY